MLGWIRNLLGIRKDVADFEKVKIDTLKAELEVDKLEDEASERNLITRATMEDIKKYNISYQELETAVEKIRSDSAQCLINDFPGFDDLQNSSHRELDESRIYTTAVDLIIAERLCQQQLNRQRRKHFVLRQSIQVLILLDIILAIILLAIVIAILYFPR